MISERCPEPRTPTGATRPTTSSPRRRSRCRRRTRRSTTARSLLPEDPTGSAEPHDVLAAEEFAMPAAEAWPMRADPSAQAGSRVAQAEARRGRPAAVGVACVLARRRRRAS